MSPSWHTISVPDATPKLGTNPAAALYGLGSGQYDGHPGRIRVGTGVDARIEDFLWDVNARAGAGGWIGARAYVLVKTDDAWGLDWTRQPISAVRNQWARPNGGVGWARSGAAAILKADAAIPVDGSVFALECHVYQFSTLPPSGNLIIRGNGYVYTGLSNPSTTVVGVNAQDSAVINVADTTGFPTSGNASIGASSEPVSYTGKTGATLTGCGPHFAYAGGEAVKYPRITGVTLQFGTGGITHKGDPIFNKSPTPIIPYAPVLGGGGDPGGWGTTTTPLDHVGEIWASGFRLEERLHAWMNGSMDFKRLSIAPYYLNYNTGEDFSYPSLSIPPPAGLLGPGYTILGTDQHGAGITSPGSGTVVDERRFVHYEGDWALWSAAAPTKRVLWPLIYGKMPADANDTGQAYGVTLSLRWVQP